MGDNYVLIVCGNRQFGEEIAQLLSGEGFSRADIAVSVNEARRKLSFSEPALVIASLPLPDEPGVDFLIELAHDSFAGLIALVRAEMQSDLEQDLGGAGVMILPKPISKMLLKQTARVTVQAKRALKSVAAERDDLQKRMDERKTIEQAKWILVKALGITEPDAHRYIQKQAMNLRSTQLSVAQDIIKKYG